MRRKVGARMAVRPPHPCHAVTHTSAVLARHYGNLTDIHCLRAACKLQALVYDILSSRRKVPESDARSVGSLHTHFRTFDK